MGANSKSFSHVVKNRTSSHRNRYESIVDRTRRLFQQKTQTKISIHIPATVL